MATPCELYLVRHAIAAERGEEWPDDDKRPLTVRGVARFKEVVDGLKKLDAGVDEIFTSPLVRAKQTADLLSAGLPGTPVVKLLDALAPGNAPASVMAQLARSARRRRIALVGHEPGLGELAAHLIGAGRALPFKKGGVCRIDVESLTSRRAGALTWFVQPKLLRGLGASKPKRRA
jgi:phosphohistidine phosphatase